jgi:hypothetical protein
MLLRAVEVEKLIDDDHSVRSIWNLVGRLDLRLYYARRHIAHRTHSAR